MKKSNEFESMIGTLQEYAGKQYVIKNIIDQGDDRFEIITDKKVIKETRGGMRSFVLLQTAEELSQTSAMVLAIGSNDNHLSKIADAILDSINRLKGDNITAVDIDRARAINESAQVIANLAKVKIEIIKCSRELR